MGGSTDCIFCKIVAGAIPCHRVFEDADVLAFLDIGPLAPGHTLVIPKRHCPSMAEADPATAAALGRCLPDLVRAVQTASGASGLNVLQNNGKAAGQEVLHLHIHLIPRRAADGLGYRWNPGKYAAGEAEALLTTLRAALAS